MLNDRQQQNFLIFFTAVIIIPVFIYYFITAFTFLQNPEYPLLISILKDLTSFKTFPLLFWAIHLIKLGCCLLFFFNARWIGSLILKALKIYTLAEEKNTVISICLGLAVSGYMVFLLGLLHLLYPGVMLFIFIVISIISITDTIYFHPVKSKFPDLTLNIHLLLIIPFMLLTFIATTFPEIFYDALVYHLAIPQQYLQNNKIINIPGNIFSTLPHLVSLIYTWALSAGDIYFVKLLNFCIGILLIYTVYILGKEFAVILFITIPLTSLNMWCAGSDICMTLFLISGLIVFFEYINRTENSNMLYLSGLLLGFALASKLSAGFGIPFLFLLLMLKKYKIKIILFFAICILTPLLPWWIKNYLYTGNPFFPFLTNIFGSSTWSLESIKSLSMDMSNGYTGINTAINGIPQIMKSSIFGVKEGRAGFMGPVLLFLIPVLIINYRNKNLLTALFYFLSVISVWLFSTHMTRHLVPHLLFLLIAVSAVMEKQKTIKLLYSFLLFVNFLWVVTLFQNNYNGLKIFNGQWTLKEYLTTEHPGIYYNPSYGGYEYLNNQVNNKNNRVLLIGEARQYYCQVPAINNTVYDTPVFFQLISKSKNTAELKQWLKTEKINYILVNWGEMKRLVPEKYLNKTALAMIQDFINDNTMPVYADRWVTVYTVLSFGGLTRNTMVPAIISKTIEQ